MSVKFFLLFLGFNNKASIDFRLKLNLTPTIMHLQKFVPWKFRIPVNIYWYN